LEGVEGKVRELKRPPIPLILKLNFNGKVPRISRGKDNESKNGIWCTQATHVQ
jgi:hypothetical protein